jgi:RimJ/RimL family protein N-acetyltransferase
MRLVPPDPPLTDGAIMLRMRERRDVPAIAAASADPETLRRLDDGPLAPAEERTSVERAQERWRSGTAAPFVIAGADDDQPLGLVNVQIAGDEVAGLAVSVFPEARGKGVTPRALRLAAEWCLREAGLERVYAEAAADNLASIRAIEKAGFVREGLLRSHCKTHGQRHDCVMFSLVPGDLRT